MEELHEKRGDYVKRVRRRWPRISCKNGLELESVSLTDLDQTEMEFFNPSNAFDAEGLTRLTEQIERRKKIRNDIEQDTMIEIRNKNLEAEKLSLEHRPRAKYARLEQERELEMRRAGQRAELARERAAAGAAGGAGPDRRPPARSSARASRPSASCEGERIAQEQEIQRLEIERRKALELAEQQRAIAVAQALEGPIRGPGRGRARPGQGRVGGGEGVHARARPRWPSGARRSS